jgi:hypothetical protein
MTSDARLRIASRVLVALVLAGGCRADLSGKHDCETNAHCAAGRICVAGHCADPSEVLPGVRNYVFVSSGKFPMRFATLAEADERCSDAARMGDLPGRFVAWLSAPSVDARDRLGGARGWIRPDGTPFADTVADITGGRIFNPLSLDEFGHAVTGGIDDPIMTGTNELGLHAAGSSCNGWAANQTGEALCGVAAATTVTWTDYTSLRCDREARLYCFGVDGAAPVAPSPAPSSAKLAFLSDATFMARNGVAAADELCATEAARLGSAGTFRVLMATSTAAAAARIGASAERVWVRPDGVAINDGTGPGPFDGRPLLAPLNVTSAGRYLDVAALTGASRADTIGSLDDSCNDWSELVGGGALTGRSSHVARWFYEGGARYACDDGMVHVYCLQVD